MTKKVRIENADSSTYKVRVSVEDKVLDEAGNWTGEWKRSGSEGMDLLYPTAMTESYLTSTRRLVVEELS